MHNHVSRKNEIIRAVSKEFAVGENVLVRDYRVCNNKWGNAQIVDVLALATYPVKTGEGLLWKRHIKTSNEEWIYMDILSRLLQVNHCSYYFFCLIFNKRRLKLL